MHIIEQMVTPHISDILSYDINQRLFPSHLELLPDIKEIYELELAFYESQLLNDEVLVRNGAYFLKIGNDLTRHFMICCGQPIKLPDYSSSRLKSFFKQNQFRTGYATHGLFLYRGKFHPQMIKGLLNIMGLKQGDTVLDPMMGSGTTVIEACLMGIKSIGIDASPFCRFMTQTKIDALYIPLSRVRKAFSNGKAVFDYYNKLMEKAISENDNEKGYYSKNLEAISASQSKHDAKTRKNDTEYDDETARIHNFLLLAYLDSIGYALRTKQKLSFEKFSAILERYLFVAEKIQKVLEGAQSELAEVKVIEGDARMIPLDDASIDGIIFSPPYSFAIDYLGNDAPHLDFMGVDINKLREIMIGLRGRTLGQKFEHYKEDMERVLAECARVLHPGRLCTIIVGTNNNQLSKALHVPPEEVVGIHDILIELGLPYGLKLIRNMSRQIIGISNTMRKEHILILQRI